MSKRIEMINSFYDGYREDVRLEKSRHGQLEYFTTMHYINKMTTANTSVLEIGAGTGRYSIALAKKGYNVTAVELADKNLEILKKNAKEINNLHCYQGDALDLSRFEDNCFDLTLVLGPMYHLYTEEDRKAAMGEALRVTKKGGIVFAAYCNNDMTVYQFGFRRGAFQSGKYDELIDFETFKLASTPKEIFALYRKEDVDVLMEDFHTERLHYVGTDMLTHFIGSEIDGMDEKMFDMYMKYHLCICERPDMIGTTNHMLDIFRKE